MAMPLRTMPPARSNALIACCPLTPRNCLPCVVQQLAFHHAPSVLGSIGTGQGRAKSSHRPKPPSVP